MADLRRPLLAALLAFATAAFAADAPASAPSAAADTSATIKFQPPTATLTAADPALEARMLAITDELRCLVCQNQTIADSHADLAVDLRQQVREMLKRGMTDDQVRRYMTDRYGDFILYRPPLKATTAVLWLGPALLLAVALVALAVVIRRRARLADDRFEPDPVFEGDVPDLAEPAVPPWNSRMTLFVILCLLLVATALAILVWRAPVDAHVTDAATATAAVTRPTRGLVLGLALLVLVVAGGGYAWVGSPRLLPVTPDAPPGPGASADAQADAMQARAEKHPDDASGWLQAARVQAVLNHGPAAVADYRKAAALRPNDANVLADLADMLAATGNGSLDGEPIQLVDKALAIDPNHVKALALKGSYAMTQRDFRTALTAWNQALKVAQPDDPIAQFLRTQLDGMREMAARATAASAPAAGGK